MNLSRPLSHLLDVIDAGYASVIDMKKYDSKVLVISIRMLLTRYSINKCTIEVRN